jgi:hypothetical protein
MNVEVGKVAFMKTSDEPVFVLEIDGKVARVRRPVQTEDGVFHRTETFELRELHTKKAAIVAEMELNRFMLEQRDQLADERRKASKDAGDPFSEPKESFLN